MKRNLLLILFLWSALTGLQAQKLTVEGMTASPMDLSASQYERKDLAGQACGLVKVQLAVAGAQFEGNVIGTPEYKTGEYWVYMSEGSYMLTVKHPNYIPLRVNFRDLNIPGIQSKITYELTLLIPQAVPVVDKKVETFTVKGVSFNMIRVDGGTLKIVRNNKKSKNEVTLNTFFVGETEVTQKLWKTVMGSNPSKFDMGSQLPVEMVSWNDCQLFIQRLNNVTGQKFRLPTEAEWEFAARGGNNSKNYEYSGSNELDIVGWYWKNSHEKTHKVGQKSPNELGIYDMSGNVWEWCQDRDYSRDGQTKSTELSPESLRICRGGSWSSVGDYNCQERRYYPANSTYSGVGLRLAL